MGLSGRSGAGTWSVPHGKSFAFGLQQAQADGGIGWFYWIFCCSAASFVELVASPAMGQTECLIELEGPRGKIRILWKGTTGPDLAGLSRALWELA